MQNKHVPQAPVNRRNTRTDGRGVRTNVGALRKPTTWPPIAWALPVPTPRPQKQSSRVAAQRAHICGPHEAWQTQAWGRVSHPLRDQPRSRCPLRSGNRGGHHRDRRTWGHYLL